MPPDAPGGVRHGRYGHFARIDTTGRVPKARILEAVREAKSEHSAQIIAHLKKAAMAKEADPLLDGTGWLPEPLRLAGTEPAGKAEALPDFLTSEDAAVRSGKLLTP
jgi:ParB family chromosome partitioning protein